MTRAEASKAVQYYVELIEDRLESGESEALVLENLGSPRLLAHRIIGEFLERYEQDKQEGVSHKKQLRVLKGREDFFKNNMVLILALSPILLPLAIATLSIAFALVITAIALFFSIGVAVIAVFASMVVSFVAFSIGLVAYPIFMITTGASGSEIIVVIGFFLAGVGLTGLFALGTYKLTRLLFRTIYTAATFRRIRARVDETLFVQPNQPQGQGQGQLHLEQTNTSGS